MLHPKRARWSVAIVLVIVVAAVSATLWDAHEVGAKSIHSVHASTVTATGPVSAHPFTVSATSEYKRHDCVGQSENLVTDIVFGEGLGACVLVNSGSANGWNRLDWDGNRGGTGALGITLLDLSGSVLDGSMSDRGSGSLTINSGALQGSGATSNITTGTSQPAGQVNGPLHIDVQYNSNLKMFTFTINGYLNYGTSDTTRVATKTTLVQLPTASPGQNVTYLATVSPSNSAQSQTYGTFRFTFTGRVRQSDNCRNALEDSSGRAYCTVSYSLPGSFSVTARFGGTDYREASDDTVSQVIDDRPYATVVPATLQFAFQPGKTSLAQSVTVTGNGKAAVVVSSVAVQGSNDYHISDENCTGTSSLKPCTILVTLTASSGAPSGKLVITDNAANSPQIVQLQELPAH